MTAPPRDIVCLVSKQMTSRAKDISDVFVIYTETLTEHVKTSHIQLTTYCR